MPSLTASLVLALIVLPLVGAALVKPASARGRTVRDALVVSTAVLTLGATAALIPLADGAYPLRASIPFLLAEATFALDLLGHLLAVLVTFVWACCTLHATAYLKDDRAADRFHITSLVALAATLGVVLAGDLVTLFLAFEVLGVIAYLFIVHKQTRMAEHAASKYLALTIVGGLILLSGILVTYYLGSDGSLAPFTLREGVADLRWLAAALMVLGFGVKAGMLPVHVWLPDAHSVAPSPASALLSGLLIKTGAYGIFRTLYVLAGPPSDTAGTPVDPVAAASAVLLVLGLAGMIAGIVIALAQDDLKRMLAYSSVSQIGFVLAGLGAAAVLGTDRAAAYALAGSFYHVVNHALYKAALFLAAGAILKNAGTTDLRRLGGLRYEMPRTFAIMLVAAAGITGLPFLNGFASKSLLHHGIEAADPVRVLGFISPMEVAFILAGGGTVAVLAKLLWSVFGGPKRADGAGVADAPPRMLAAMGALCAAMLAIGLAPLTLLREVLVPVARDAGLDPAVLLDYRQFTAEHLGFTLLSFAIGGAIMALDRKSEVFRVPLPSWLSVDHWYQRAAGAGISLAERIADVYERYLEWAARALRSASTSAAAIAARARRFRQRLAAHMIDGSPQARASRVMQEIEESLDRDRQATTDRAVTFAEERQREAPACPGRGCDEYVDAVRDIVGYIAWRLRNDRIATARSAVHRDPDRSLEAVKIALREKSRDTAERVISEAHELALRRMAGENVLPEISSLMLTLLRSEDFEESLSKRMSAGGLEPRAPDSPSLTDDHPGPLITDRTPDNRIVSWVSDLARVIVAAFTRERTDWGDEPPEQERVSELRRLAASLTQDLDLALTIMLVALVAVVLIAR